MFGYKKKYYNLLSKHQDLIDKVRSIDKGNLENLKKIDQLKNTLDIKLQEIENLEKEKLTLNGSKGGLTKQNNKLVKLNTDLRLRNEQLEEENKNLHELNDRLLNNRYKVRKIRGTKATKDDIKLMGMRRGVTNSNAKKILKITNESK